VQLVLNPIIKFSINVSILNKVGVSTCIKI
jgi:hypothetical protein